MIFYGKTFAEKCLEAKGHKHDSLERENARLKAEIEKLKQQVKQNGKRKS